MPRRQPDFTLSKNDISEIKQIRDSTDLYDYKYKIAVTLLELDKQTPGKIIARELNLRQNTVTDIRKRYEKLGMNSFNKEPRKNAFEKKHIDADLIKLVNELNERGFSKTLEEIAEELNCSISTVQRALKRNGLRLTKDEKDYCDPNVISTIIDGFLLIFLQLEVASGYALLYTNNQDYKTFSKKIINLRKKFYNTSDGSSFLLQAVIAWDPQCRGQFLWGAPSSGGPPHFAFPSDKLLPPLFAVSLTANHRPTVAHDQVMVADGINF